MAIPDLTANGFLPPGVHPCDLEELQERFGRFRGSDRRPSLFRDLEAYVAEVRAAGVAKALIVNGSFVADKDRPSDIDVLLVLKDGVDLAREVPPFQYNARSKRYVQRHYRLDFRFGFDGDSTAEDYIEYWSRVRGLPGTGHKGMVRIDL